MGPRRQPIPRPFQLQQHARGRLGGVVADAVGEAAVADGVVGEDEGDAALGAGGGAEAGPVEGEVGGAGDAAGIGGVGGERALGAGVPDGIGLVADEEAAEAAIDLGHDHVHGEVLRGETLRIAGPLALERPDWTSWMTGASMPAKGLSAAARSATPRAKAVRLRMAAGRTAERTCWT